MTYESSITLGEKYCDPQTGIVGTAVAVTFYQFACERVSIEAVINGEIKDYAFDAPRLESAATGERAKASRPGGPGAPVAGRKAVGR